MALLMSRLLLISILGCVILENVHAVSANCPSSSRVDSCAPKCTDHSNCPGAQMCCSNICNGKSCTNMNQYLSGDKNGNKGSLSSSKGGTGTYCGNVKCSSYEKCELDRTSKRMKCVRG